MTLLGLLALTLTGCSGGPSTTATATSAVGTPRATTPTATFAPAGAPSPAPSPDPAAAPASNPPAAAAASHTGTTNGTATSKVTLPPANGQFDYQIGGPYPPVAAVAIVDRDHGQSPVSGKYNICYVNAFQTQPEQAAFWTAQHPDLIVRRGTTPVTDPNWPGEFILDTSTPAKRAAITAIIEPWISECAQKGFQAVEPDNLDSWTRSANLLTQSDNVALATELTRYAHQLGLAVAQKNTGQLGAAGPRDVHFDFALAEECQVYDECATYTAVYGDHVIEVEYTDNGTEAYRQACARQGRQISVILRDRDVVARGQDGYDYQAC